MNVVCRGIVVGAALLLAACGAGTGVEDETEGAVQGAEPLASGEAGELESEIHAQLKVTPIEDPAGLGSRTETKTRVVLGSAQAYQKYFGHAAPASVDFAAGDVVIFYAAGVQNTGGYEANVLTVSRSHSGRTLYVTTQLVSPGSDCVVTMALTEPHALVKVRAPKQASYVKYLTQDETRSCTPYNPCAATLCPVNTECVVKQVQCITTPCDPIAECVPFEPKPFCGGFAGIPCKGAATCVDDPSDSCDPNNGGADCGGVCECNAVGLCAQGLVWDDSPGVCGCVKAPVADGGAAGEACGKTTCGAGTVCCNASCGICTPPGGACIQLACN